MSLSPRSPKLAAVFLLSLALACDAPDFFDPEPPGLPDAYCCPSWLGTDSLVIYRDEGLSEVGRRGLWVSRVDGSESWMCLAGDVYTPSYSAVAASLAFESGMQISVADVVGGVVDTLTIRQVTTNGNNFLPSWSPDGAWIAHDRRLCDLGSGDADTTCGIFVTRPDASETRFVIQGYYPAWSPGGTSLAFALRGEVYSVDFPSLANLTLLTSIQSAFHPAPSVGALSYSPDGSEILVEIRTTPESTIWTIPSGGGSPTRIVVGEWPSWSPSGGLVAFIAKGDADSEKNGTVWILDRLSRQARQFTRR